MDTDFAIQNTTGPTVTIGSGGSGSAWDTSAWDTTAWGTGVAIRQATLSRGKIADAFSVRVRTETNDRSISWNATNLIYRPAGVI